MTMHKYSDLILRGTLPNTIREAQECYNTARTGKNLPQQNIQVAEDNAPCHTGGISAKTRREQVKSRAYKKTPLARRAAER